MTDWPAERVSANSSRGRIVMGGLHHYERSFFAPPTPKHGALLVPRYCEFFGGQFAADFEIKAIIFDPRVRYKQYIKGKYLYNGKEQMHLLRDGPLNPTKFLEDRNGNGTYGDRGGIMKAGRSVYKRLTDSAGLSYDEFSAYDTPGDLLKDCPPGTVVVIDLTFRGELVDKNGNVHEWREWRVFGSYKTTGGAVPTLKMK